MKSKTKLVKKKIGDDTILKLFNQMTGVEDADPVLIEKKYDNMRFYMKKIITAWSIFIESKHAEAIRKEFPKGYEEILEFVKSGREFLSKTLQEETNKTKTEFTEDLFNDLYDMSSKYNSKELNEAYRELKSSKILQHIIVTLENLKLLLEDDKNRTGVIFGCLDIHTDLRNTFFTKTELDTKILSFSVLDFQFMYKMFDPVDEEFNKLTLYALYITYINSYEIYKIFITPDIDIEKFVKAFGEKLEEIKKVIPNCGEAFKTLSKSLNLLRKNFGVYYKKFMTTNNPSIIFESFLADVQERNKNNITIMSQFKNIVSYIKKNLPQSVQSNPAVSKLWNLSDKIFDNIK